MKRTLPPYESLDNEFLTKKARLEDSETVKIEITNTSFFILTIVSIILNLLICLFIYQIYSASLVLEEDINAFYEYVNVGTQT